MTVIIDFHVQCCCQTVERASNGGMVSLSVHMYRDTCSVHRGCPRLRGQHLGLPHILIRCCPGLDIMTYLTIGSAALANQVARHACMHASRKPLRVQSLCYVALQEMSGRLGTNENTVAFAACSTGRISMAPAVPAPHSQWKNLRLPI